MRLINDEGHLDAATHLCLHAAGQYQPFFFTSPPFVPASAGVEAIERICLQSPFPNPFRIHRCILHETTSQAKSSSPAGCKP